MNADELWEGLDEDEDWEDLIPVRFKKIVHPKEDIPDPHDAYGSRYD